MYFQDPLCSMVCLPARPPTAAGLPDQRRSRRRLWPIVQSPYVGGTRKLDGVGDDARSAAGEVAVYKYDYTGSTHEPDAITLELEAECDGRIRPPRLAEGGGADSVGTSDGSQAEFKDGIRRPALESGAGPKLELHTIRRGPADDKYVWRPYEPNDEFNRR